MVDAENAQGSKGLSAGSYTDQYLRHVAGQVSEQDLRTASGARQVTLASQERRTDDDRMTVPLTVLVLPPDDAHPYYRVSDNGYVSSVVGLGNLDARTIDNLLVWHVVDIEPGNGHLVAVVDDPSLIGGRIHDLEQAMLDVLRDVVSTDSATQAATTFALTQLSRSRDRRGQDFLTDVTPVLEYLWALLPEMTWTVTLRAPDGTCTNIAVRGATIPGLADTTWVWDETIVGNQARGKGPVLAPDVSVIPAYAPLAGPLGVKSFLGATMFSYDGTAIGALSGKGPDASTVERLAPYATLVELFAAVLGRAWDAHALLSKGISG